MLLFLHGNITAFSLCVSEGAFIHILGETLVHRAAVIFKKANALAEVGLNSPRKKKWVSSSPPFSLEQHENSGK